MVSKVSKTPITNHFFQLKEGKDVFFGNLALDLLDLASIETKQLAWLDLQGISLVERFIHSHVDVIVLQFLLFRKKYDGNGGREPTTAVRQENIKVVKYILPIG